MIKSTAIDPRVLDDDGIYRLTGPARVFTSERDVDRCDQGHRRCAHPAGRRHRPRGSRPARLGDGGDLPAHLSAEVPSLRARGGPDHGRALLGCLDRRLRRARQPGGTRGRADRPTAATAMSSGSSSTGSDSRRPSTSSVTVASGGRPRRPLTSSNGARCGQTSSPTPTYPRTRRVGAVAIGKRWALGWLRLRRTRRSDRCSMRPRAASPFDARTRPPRLRLDSQRGTGVTLETFSKNVPNR